MMVESLKRLSRNHETFRQCDVLARTCRLMKADDSYTDTVDVSVNKAGSSVWRDVPHRPDREYFPLPGKSVQRIFLCTDIKSLYV